MPRPEFRPLDDHLCFALYAASIAINRAYKPKLDEMGITYPQYLVLNVLGAEDGAAIGAIAERLGLESSTITPLVKRLEQAGLVERQRSAEDERHVHVRLTKAGHARLLESQCLGELLVERSGMTLQQIEELNRQVRSFRRALEGPSEKSA